MKWKELKRTKAIIIFMFKTYKKKTIGVQLFFIIMSTTWLFFSSFEFFFYSQKSVQPPQEVFIHQGPRVKWHNQLCRANPTDRFWNSEILKHAQVMLQAASEELHWQEFLAPNCSKYFLMALNGSKWLGKAPNGYKWLQMAPKSSTWPQMAHNCSKWLQMAPCCFKWLQRAVNSCK